MGASEIVIAIGVSLAATWIWSRWSAPAVSSSGTTSVTVDQSATTPAPVGHNVTTGPTAGDNPTYTASGDTPDLPSAAGAPARNGDATNLHVLSTFQAAPASLPTLRAAIGKITVAKQAAPTGTTKVGGFYPGPGGGVHR